MVRKKRFIVSIRRLYNLRPTFSILDRYILKDFLAVFVLCLFAAVSVFLVFETFERMRVFVKENTSVSLAASYLVLKIPLIIHLMTPVAVLIATLVSVGRLSLNSEITAMRACGASVFRLAKPIIFASLLISGLMFLSGETILPWATMKGEEMYQLDIRKRAETGRFSQENFWYRNGKKFYNIAFYNSRNSTLQKVSVYEMDNEFEMHKRTDAERVEWSDHPRIRWTMNDVTEILIEKKGKFTVTRYPKLPLLIDETPSYFYKIQQIAETLSYTELKEYIEKLKNDGVPVTQYLVDLAAKIAFPFVNLIVVLVAFPLALISSRSGNLGGSVVYGITIGFSYYVVHAVCTSLGGAELIPIIPSAWAANILLGSVGGYLLMGAEFRQ